MKIYKSEGFDDQYVFTPEEKSLIQYALWEIAEGLRDFPIISILRQNSLTYQVIREFWGAFIDAEDYTLPVSKTYSKKGE